MDSQWTSVVTLVCKWQGGTEHPVFVSNSDCTLRFLWKSSLFCDGRETCAAEDKDSGYTYDLDSLLSNTWNGLVHGGKGRFELGVCRMRSLNPFSSGNHCSSPAGICWHKSDSEHINLGHMTGPPVYVGGESPHILLNYTNGDVCSEAATGRKHSTTVSLTCGPGKSVDAADWTIDVCLCPSEACSKWGGANVSAHRTSSAQPQSWGKFSKLSVSSANSGPVISFTSGDVCRCTTKYKTDIYMECDRSITTDDSKPVFQQSMSSGCTKVLFLSSPYACHSERTSCTHTAGNRFFDFTPLQANPGEKAWKTHHSRDEYYVNLCGSIPEFTGCDPESAVCLHTSKGE